MRRRYEDRAPTVFRVYDQTARSLATSQFLLSSNFRPASPTVAELKNFEATSAKQDEKMLTQARAFIAR